MTHLTPVLSRKHLLPVDEATPKMYDTRSVKRQRSTSPRRTKSSDLHLYANAPPTPPSSAKKKATMALKLIIPQEETGREQQRKANRHRADAERWKSKLQRPFPKMTEVKQAYPLKLMRHYPNTSGATETNFHKPRIDNSPRVSRLLEQFPLMVTTHPVRSGNAASLPSPLTPLDQAKTLSSRMEELMEARSVHTGLQTNIHITETKHAQRLAWEAFSQTEQDRIDRGREAMIQSGLTTDDLCRETFGYWNMLPEWKKFRTGRFAKEHGAAS